LDISLKNMYRDLGSQWLSKAVQESWIPKGTPMETDKSRILQVRFSYLYVIYIKINIIIKMIKIN